MASVFLKRGQWYARLKGDKHPGKWSDAPTGYGEPQKEAAERFAREAQKAIDKRRGVREPGSLSLRDWVKRWLIIREESGHDWKKDRGKLEKHVLPIIGGVDVHDVTAAQIAEIVHALRFREKLANRTVRNIYSVLAAVFRDARIDPQLASLVKQSPCVLTEAQLGSITDKDPEWRAQALFSRDEVETLVSDPRIPQDRQVVYALGLLAGLRPGEGAALRWRHYDMACGPLGKLTVAHSYATNHSVQKRTKTLSVRYVPVHPVLAEVLHEWRAFGWPAMFGAEPGPDDLIVPLPPDVKRTKRTGERFRGWDYTGRRWREIDEPKLSWRHRSVYDTRATFITLALEDGADREILEQRVTHTKNRRSAFTGYDRGERWAETCREVAKLRVRRLAAVCSAVSEAGDTTTESGLRRRGSNAQSSPLELRVIQGGRGVIECSCHPEGALLSASLLRDAEGVA
jgi:integrase